MKGSPKVIEVLNEVLTGELTAINQYFIHAKMCADWGFDALAAKIRTESIDEMKHADIIMSRILFLEGVPNVQRYFKVNVGEDVPEQFKLDLALENEAIPRLQAGVECCRAEHDEPSAQLLERILASEQDHVDWLEAQLHIIEQVGLANYLAQQLR